MLSHLHPNRFVFTSAVAIFLVLAGTGIGAQEQSSEEVELSDEEITLLDRMQAEPVENFIPAATQALTEIGCVLDMEDEDGFRQALAENVAAQLDHDAPLNPLMVETIGFATQGAAFMMLGQGDVILDDEENTVTLVDCEATE